MEEPTFLDKLKLHVTTDFLRGILFLFVVYYVSILYFNISNMFLLCIYGGSEFLIESWKMSTLAGFVGLVFLAFVALAAMLFLRSQHCAKFTLALITALFAINVFGFFLMALLRLLNASAESPFSAIAFGLVHLQTWLRYIFIIACAAWFYKKWKSEPYTEESFWKRIEFGATTNFLRGILVAYATSWVYNTIFALIRNDQWYFRGTFGNTWLWIDTWLKVAALLVFILAYCAIVVMLFMQTQRSAKFALVVLIAMLTFKVLAFFAFAPPEIKCLPTEISFGYIVSILQRWFTLVFFIALATWHYVKSKITDTETAI